MSTDNYYRFNIFTTCCIQLCILYFNNSTGSSAATNTSNITQWYVDAVQAALEYVTEVEKTRDNCTFGKALPLTYDATRWEYEASVAVKAANLLTDILTTAEDHMRGSHAIDDYLLYSIVRSNIEEFPTIVGSAIAFDKYYYRDYELFCPYAWRRSGLVYTKDLSIGYYYHDPAADWFNVPYVRFGNLSAHLKTSTPINQSLPIGNDGSTGLPSPLITLEDGYWTYPYFDCGGGDVWMITFSVPFFRLIGRNETVFTDNTSWIEIGSTKYPEGNEDVHQVFLKFAGVTTIDVDLDQVDINQCDVSEGVQVGYDPFINTHKCKKETTQCVFIPGQGFKTGAYTCQCKRGYYYPHSGTGYTGFNGTEVEDQYNKKIHNELNEYDTYYDCLPCRAGCDECKDYSPCFVQQNVILKTIIVAINGIPMLALFGFFLFTFKQRENKVVKAASPGLLYVILIGAFIIYSGIIIEYFTPNYVTCVLSPWVHHIGFALAYGALLFKTWRITVIFRVRSAKPIRIKDSQLYIKIIILTTVLVLYLSVWTALNRVKAVIRYNEDGLKYWVCTFDGWHYGGMALELALLIWGVYLCIRVRKAPSQFNESQYISLAIYNETLLTLFLIVIRVILQNNSRTEIIFIVSFVRTQLTVTFMVTLLFGSKIFLIRKRANESENENRTTTGLTAAVKLANKKQAVINMDAGTSVEGIEEPIEFKRDKEEVQDELKRIYGEMEFYAGQLKIISSQVVTDSPSEPRKATSLTREKKKQTSKSKDVETSGHLRTLDPEQLELQVIGDISAETVNLPTHTRRRQSKSEMPGAESIYMSNWELKTKPE